MKISWSIQNFDFEETSEIFWLYFKLCCCGAWGTPSWLFRFQCNNRRALARAAFTQSICSIVQTSWLQNFMTWFIIPLSNYENILMNSEFWFWKTWINFHALYRALILYSNFEHYYLTNFKKVPTYTFIQAYSGLKNRQNLITSSSIIENIQSYSDIKPPL